MSQDDLDTPTGAMAQIALATVIDLQRENAQLREERLGMEARLQQAEWGLGQANASLVRSLAENVALTAERVRLRELLDWLAQTVHRAHHEGPLDTCEKATCQTARAATNGSASIPPEPRRTPWV